VYTAYHVVATASDSAVLRSENSELSIPDRWEVLEKSDVARCKLADSEWAFLAVKALKRATRKTTVVRTICDYQPWKVASGFAKYNKTGLSFKYRSSTIPGSSGSPVMNAVGQVIGIHLLGDNRSPPLENKGVVVMHFEEETPMPRVEDYSEDEYQDEWEEYLISRGFERREAPLDPDDYDDSVSEYPDESFSEALEWTPESGDFEGEQGVKTHRLDQDFGERALNGPSQKSKSKRRRKKKSKDSVIHVRSKKQESPARKPGKEKSESRRSLRVI
jgi:hypothetical protein